PSGAPVTIEVSAPTVRCYHCLHVFAWDTKTIYRPELGTGAWEMVSLADITDGVERDEALRNAYVRCPNPAIPAGAEHYLPLGYARYLPPLVIGLVGAKNVGKTTLLTTMVDEISRGRLTPYGFMARPLVDSVHADFQKDSFNVLLGKGTAVAAT